MHYLTKIRFALVLRKIHFTLDDKLHFCGICNVMLAHLTSFLLKKAFNQREMLVLALFSLVLHNSMRLHVFQCFHCVKTENVHKTRF